MKNLIGKVFTSPISCINFQPEKPALLRGDTLAGGAVPGLFTSFDRALRNSSLESFGNFNPNSE
jgi:hypothetical protein